jgi:hypothetical protein
MYSHLINPMHTIQDSGLRKMETFGLKMTHAYQWVGLRDLRHDTIQRIIVNGSIRLLGGGIAGCSQPMIESAATYAEHLSDPGPGVAKIM